MFQQRSSEMKSMLQGNRQFMPSGELKLKKRIKLSSPCPRHESVPQRLIKVRGQVKAPAALPLGKNPL